MIVTQASMIVTLSQGKTLWIVYKTAVREAKISSLGSTHAWSTFAREIAAQMQNPSDPCMPRTALHYCWRAVRLRVARQLLNLTEGLIWFEA